MEDFTGLWYECENLKTTTSNDQCSCEKECSNFLKPFSTYSKDVLKQLQEGGLINVDKEIRLLRSMHSIYLTNGLSNNLPGGFVSLDASRPWIMYWIVHALYLLDTEPKFMYPRIISTLKYFQNKTGGFGGGPGQLTQGAPNYAGVLALCTIASDEALAIIDRPAMYNHFLAMKHACGGFTIHTDGEVDSRSTYTVIAIARILNILTPQLIEGVAEYVLSCQTYEGGFGGEPSNEAHGGYNFCALATLLILKQAHRCDIAAQEHWLLQRQVKLEGGFQGRTNKLVDSCYSFWQGGALAMVEIIKHLGSDTYDLEQYLEYQNKRATSNDVAVVEEEGVESVELADNSKINTSEDTTGCLAFNQKALQRYILHCAQNVDAGGMRDKPGKSRDFYHSCYALSGLSIAQSCITATPVEKEGNAKLSDVEDESESLPQIEYDWSGAQVYGDLDNLLAPTSAVFNIGLKKLQFALQYFSDKPSVHEELLSLYKQNL